MLFNSIQFLIFFAVVVLVYFTIPHRWRWLFLLAASYYFYMCWRMEYILLIVFSTLVDYFAALGIDASRTRRQRNCWLATSLTTNFSLLFAFKYFNFFADSVRAAFQTFNICQAIPELNVLLPVGISFYTFQTVSYTIDVYRGDRPAERNLGIFSLYVSFFPQLVAGPIERSTRLMPQFRQETSFNESRAVTGLQLMLWGFVKKVVIADRLAQVVVPVYLAPQKATCFELLLATICFAFQIYCDFSAYSDIAIGSARILGFDLMKNFQRPFLSKSIAEFWRRWHISLSTWFRDYLFIPLGGSRLSSSRTCFNLAVVFLLSGLWHGANWTFVVWGGLHATYMIIGRLFARKQNGTTQPASGLLSQAAKIVFSFALVDFAWIFFRANNLSDALYISRTVIMGFRHPFQEYIFPAFAMSPAMMLAMALIGLLMTLEVLEQKITISSHFRNWPLPCRWAVYYCGIYAILLLGVLENDAFIYFQF